MTQFPMHDAVTSQSKCAIKIVCSHRTGHELNEVSKFFKKYLDV